jgi:hypothetical protein
MFCLVVKKRVEEVEVYPATPPFHGIPTQHLYFEKDQGLARVTKYRLLLPETNEFSVRTILSPLNSCKAPRVRVGSISLTLRHDWLRRVTCGAKPFLVTARWPFSVLRSQ